MARCTTKTVLLTHEALRHGVKTEKLPDVSGALSRVRKLLLEGNAELADRVIADAMDAADYQADIGTPLPLGDLKIRMPGSQGFKNYRRIPDMETGEVIVSWTDDGFAYERKLFVSRPADRVVMSLRSEGGSLEADVSLDLHDRPFAMNNLVDPARRNTNVFSQTAVEGTPSHSGQSARSPAQPSS